MPTILVVDDEKNIRMSLSRSMESAGVRVDTAVNGEEALQKLEAAPCALLLLDLKLPGMDGLQVLQRVREGWPEVPIVIISAVGTVDSAVQAMKLGAVDFLQKPFSPDEIRAVVSRVLAGRPGAPAPSDSSEVPQLLEEARRQMAERRFDLARDCVQRAISADPGRPEAYNLLGAITESAEGDRIEAQRFYRAALDIDPTYAPARANLERVAIHGGRGDVDLGDSPTSPTTDRETGPPTR